MNKNFITMAVLCAIIINMHAATIGIDWRALVPSMPAAKNFGTICKQWATDNPGKAFTLGVGTGALATYWLSRMRTHAQQPQASTLPMTPLPAVAATSSSSWQLFASNNPSSVYRDLTRPYDYGRQRVSEITGVTGFNNNILSPDYQPSALANELLQQDEARYIEAMRKFFVLARTAPKRLSDIVTEVKNKAPARNKLIQTLEEIRYNPPNERKNYQWTAYYRYYNWALMPIAYDMLSVVLNPRKSSVPDIASPEANASAFIRYMQTLQKMIDKPAAIPSIKNGQTPAIAYMAKLKAQKLLEEDIWSAEHVHTLAAFALVGFLEHINPGFRENSVRQDTQLRDFLAFGDRYMHDEKARQAVAVLFREKFIRSGAIDGAPTVQQLYDERERVIDTTNRIASILLNDNIAVQKVTMQMQKFVDPMHAEIKGYFATNEAIARYKDAHFAQTLNEARNLARTIPYDAEHNTPENIRTIVELIAVARDLYPVAKALYNDYFATEFMSHIVSSWSSPHSKAPELLEKASPALLSDQHSYPDKLTYSFDRDRIPRLDAAAAQAAQIQDERTRSAIQQSLEKIRNRPEQLSRGDDSYWATAATYSMSDVGSDESDSGESHHE